VLLCNSTANSRTSASRAVVWALWRWLAAIRIETIGNGRDFTNLSWFHEGVLLLNTKPRIMGLVLLHDCGTLCPCITNSRLAIPSVPGIAHDKDVGRTTEWISEDSAWPDVYLRVVPLCLFSAAPIVVPDLKILNARWRFGHRHCLGARRLMCIKPHILSHDTALVTLHVWQSFLLTSWWWCRREGSTSSLHYDPCHSIWVTVCCWAPVFHVPALILFGITRNTD